MSAYVLGNQRSYGAWGEIRRAATGGPRGRYCANLGHIQDDETGLVYMRARYYEPTSGRFVSQDEARTGLNWFTYADNIPTCLSDSSGDAAIDTITQAAIVGLIFGFYLAMGSDLFGNDGPPHLGLSAANEFMAAAVGSAGNWLLAWVGRNILGTPDGLGVRIPKSVGYLRGFMAAGVSGLALGLILKLSIHMGECLYYIWAIDNE